MALRDGEPYLAWGSPAAISRINGPAILFADVHAKMNLQEAIDAPDGIRNISDLVLAAYRPSRCARGREPRAESHVATLKSRGHIVETGPDWSEGRLTAASKVGARRAAANPRGMQGYAAGR